MIEYVYSRMIATIASAAMVALVFSVSLASSDADIPGLSEEIASVIRGEVDAAFHIDADYYEQRCSFPWNGHGDLISIQFTRSSVHVTEEARSAIETFENDVVLMDSNCSVESFFVLPGMEISIRACRMIFEKENVVTIELISH